MNEPETLSFVSGYQSYDPKTNKRYVMWAALAIHVVAISAIVVLPLFQIGRDLPEVVSMAAFLVRAPQPAPTPPPPPPPPSPAAARPKPERRAPRAFIQNASFVAPLIIPDTVPTEEFGGSDGYPIGGVEGGVPGGVVGGIVGGLASAPVQEPVEPARLDFRAAEARPTVRVDPNYPDLAREAHVQGVVILEVLVDHTGMPSMVNVLRSESLLQEAAIDAVEQWRWAPYEIAGRAMPFWVTVTVTFRLT